MNLLLIPTQREHGTIAAIAGPHLDDRWRVELCGFGPVAAAARTAQLLAEWRPQLVCLVGIAGAIDPRLTLGRAYAFSAVACDGVGAGSGEAHRTAEELGWQQWFDPESGLAISGHLPLAVPDDAGMIDDGGLLLTCCSASASDDEVRVRKARFPSATAEDMEGFAVAVACQLFDVPLQIIRGISNVAGERDKSTWQIEPALTAAAQSMMQWSRYHGS